MDQRAIGRIKYNSMHTMRHSDVREMHEEQKESLKMTEPCKDNNLKQSVMSFRADKLGLKYQRVVRCDKSVDGRACRRLPTPIYKHLCDRRSRRLQ